MRQLRLETVLKLLYCLSFYVANPAFSETKDPTVFTLGGLGLGASDEELLGGSTEGLNVKACETNLHPAVKPTTSGPKTKTAGASTPNNNGGAANLTAGALTQLGIGEKFPRPYLNQQKDETKGIDKLSDLADFLSPDLRTKKLAPVFLSGELGSGRTAFMEWIAREAQKPTNQLPNSLKKKKFYSLDLAKISGDTALQDMAGYIGLVQQEEAILFIPRGRSMVPNERDNLSEEGIKARRLLLNKIESGEIRVVIEGDYEVFSKLEKTFTRFRTVEIVAPKGDQLRDILNAYKQDLEKNFPVTIQPEAIEQLVVMSNQFLISVGLPGAAVEILEAEVERAIRNRSGNEKAVVSVSEVARGLAKKTGRDVSEMSRNERENLIQGREILSRRVFGQPEGINAVVEAVEYATSPIKAPDDMTPYDFILLLGPSGVGKTETAKAAAEWLNVPLIERNMEQYIEKHTLSEILGSPPGYEGSGDKTTMVHEIRKKIKAVVLLDEMEKAHEEIKQAFLGAPENGKLVGRDRAEANLRETLWIMASNAANELISAGASKEEIMAELHRHFPAPFLGRCRIVIYRKFDRKDLRQIVPMVEKKFVSTLAKSNTKVTIDGSVLDGVVEATNVDLGARNLRNTFRNLISKPLAGPYHRGIWKKGDSIRVFRKDDEIWFEVTSDGPNPKSYKLSNIEKYLTLEEQAAAAAGDATVQALGAQSDGSGDETKK